MKTIEQIQTIPISTIISKYVPLTPYGNNLIGLCPFHADTKPSLKVNDDKGRFKCFVCGTGGDGITFIMSYKRILYMEAIDLLAREHL
jgi:DNA primase